MHGMQDPLEGRDIGYALDQGMGGESHFCVALSGGLDSSLLLHEVAQRVPADRLRAIHVNHGLSPNADQWQAHCEAACTHLGIELVVCPVQVTPDGQGLEAAAREVRYQAFERSLRVGETLLMAHHADDQMETLLLRLARGSGLTGLRGMAERRPLGKGQLWRPLLSFPRAALEARARALNLHWIEDDSNGDERFDRNYLRHTVVPTLRRRWPDVALAWARSAHWCAEGDDLLRDYARQDIRRLLLNGGEWGRHQALSISELGRLPAPRRRLVVRTWLADAGLSSLPRARLAELDRQLGAVAGTDGEPFDATTDCRVDWRGGSLRRYRDGLYLLPAGVDALGWPSRAGTLPCDLTHDRSVVDLPGGDQLVFERLAHGRRLVAGLAPLHVRYRQGGERCRPAGRGHSQTLKRLLQEYAVPPWWRQRIPLIYSDDELVAVGDVWICEGYEAPPGQPGYGIAWHIGSAPEEETTVSFD